MNCYQIYQEFLDSNRVPSNLKRRYSDYTTYIKDLHNLKNKRLAVRLARTLMQEYTETVLVIGLDLIVLTIYNNCVSTKFKEFINEYKDK